MSTVRRLFFLLVAAVAAVTVACGDIQPYAAKVNGARISREQLDAELEAIKSNEEYLKSVESQLAAQGGKVLGSGQGTFDAAFVARVLTRQILLELVRQEVAERDLEVTKKDLDEAQSSVTESFGDEQLFKRFPAGYRETLVRRTAEVNVLQRALVDQASVEQYYEENRESFARTCTRHILTGGFQGEASAEQIEQARQQAAQIKARLDAGEDFAAIAKAESKDTVSGAKGGDLECQPKGSFVPEFEQAAEQLQPGQVSAPVQTQFGFHIIQVTERKTQTLEEATPEITQRLAGNAVGEFVNEAIEKARIEVNPRYGTFDKEGDQPGVVPPKAPSADEADVPGGGQGGVPGAGQGRPGQGGAPAGGGQQGGQGQQQSDQ